MIPGHVSFQTSEALLFISSTRNSSRLTPFLAGDDDLRSDFGKFGNITDVFMPQDRYSGKPRGFAFITFEDPRDAEDACKDMNG